MDLSYSQEHEDFRQDVRGFLADNWPLEGAEAELPRQEQDARFRERAIERGYLARPIPRKYGGSEQTPEVLKGTIIREEFGRAGAPRDPGVHHAQIVPTLLTHASEWQKKRLIPPTLRGRLLWCQGYSEPGSGSDLASVQTRAERVGDEWVINGQKIWTSDAHEAEMMYLLCRTDPDAPKHAGMSYLLLRMDQPGVNVRPLEQMDGGAHFSEVFFDDARTPADHIVGKRGEGWIVSRSTLHAERNVVGNVTLVRRHLDSLLRLARDTVRDGRHAIADPLVRQRLVELDGYVTAQEYSAYRQLTCDARGENPGPGVMMNKLVATNIAQLAARIGLDLIGEKGLSAPIGGRFGAAPETGAGWVARYMAARSTAIAGGTSNIQRNIIGERGLGLPRDFAAQRSK